MGRIVGLLLICLFALPFAGFGLFALATSVQRFLNGSTDSTQIFLGLLFGILFTGIGVGLIIATVYGSRLAQRQQRLQAEAPGEPWKWQSDWAAGRIPSGVRASTFGAWIMAAFWNLVSMPLVWALLQKPPKNPAAFIGLIFPLVGIFLLVRAVRLSLELHEFGKTWFQMDSVPAVVGRELKGNIHVNFSRTPDHGINLQLTCVRRVVTGAGNSRSVSENILWRSESNLSATQLYSGPGESLIPVSFHIPWNAQQTDKTNSSNMTLWKLDAKADVPGVDYHDFFEIPVFHTEQSPSKPETGMDEATDEPPATQPQLPTIAVQQTANGTEFYFPAMRNKSFAITVAAFDLFFSGITVVLVFAHAPFFFPIAFGFFSLLLLYITLQVCLGTTRLVISNSGVTVRDGWLGGGKPRQIAFADIGSIATRIGGQQGGGSGIPYYDIELTQKDGRKVTLGHTVRDKQEAEWLAEEMRRLTGVEETKSAAAQIS